MRKILSLLISICIIMSVIPQTISAASENDNALEKEKQEKIEKIFQEMNKIALDKAMIKYLEIVDGLSVVSAEKTINHMDERSKELDLLLVDLGVKKIDPDDENSISILSELSEASMGYKDQNGKSNPTDSAPDLEALKKAFTVYAYDGTYKYKNEDHIYRYIKVIDNKGYGGLTIAKTFEAVPKNIKNSIMNSVLSYNFGLIFSKYLGLFPDGALVDWTLGNIFSILSGIKDASNVVATDKALYLTTCMSVTLMTYYYYYTGSEWKLIGTSGDISFSQTNDFNGNVNGKPEQIRQGPIEWSSRSGGIWYDYVKTYVDLKSEFPDYHQVDGFGYIEVKGFNKTFEFKPVFFAMPGEIW